MMERMKLQVTDPVTPEEVKSSFGTFLGGITRAEAAALAHATNSRNAPFLGKGR